MSADRSAIYMRLVGCQGVDGIAVTCVTPAPPRYLVSSQTRPEQCSNRAESTEIGSFQFSSQDTMAGYSAGSWYCRRRRHLCSFVDGSGIHGRIKERMVPKAEDSGRILHSSGFGRMGRELF